MRRFTFFLLVVFMIMLFSCSQAKDTLPLENSIIMGNKDAKHKIVVFYDPDCPVCTAFHKNEMEKIVAQRNDIAFYIKLFPLKELHPFAYQKSKIISCAESDAEALALIEQSSTWGSYLPDPSCDSDAVDKNLALGQELGIAGTPSLSFSKDDIVYGGARADVIMAVVDGNALVRDHQIFMK